MIARAFLTELLDVLENDPALTRRLGDALGVAADGPAPAPALLDRAGLARALSTSPATIDRLRSEPSFPELRLVDSPRFVLEDVLAWVRARSGPGLRIVDGGRR
ncbi:MAG: hypothetical protein HYZ29_13955 [Myxococcales bacterium]|nr:hypothetical protein [Myxococcales bacterium]